MSLIKSLCCQSQKNKLPISPLLPHETEEEEPENVEPDEGVDQIDDPNERSVYKFDCPICLRYYR